MAIAIVKNDNKLLLRQTDPAHNPYSEPWALFGGRLEGEGDVTTLLNKELKERWNFQVEITERLWWDEDIKADHDGETKRFIYIDAICTITSGEPHPKNMNENIEWVNVDELKNYQLNPPTRTVLQKLKLI